MDANQIRKVGRALPRFLEEFGGCFGRCDTRRYLKIYVDGQMSELHRKSVEPIALQAGVPPRSLQAFLGLLEWDEHRLVDRVQEHVAREHGGSCKSCVNCTGASSGFATQPSRSLSPVTAPSHTSALTSSDAIAAGAVSSPHASGRRRSWSS